MEEFHYAGGVPGLMKQLGGMLDLTCPTINGQTIGEIVKDAGVYNDDVIRSLDEPITPLAGTWVLTGNLCPGGAVMKPSAASSALLKHSGPAVVFENVEDYKARIDDEDLDVTADSVLVLKGCGPKGYPGMPEVGNMALPKKLLEQGVRDMVRISDARMSGTAYGTVVLHLAPEAAAGGPLGKVQTGDIIHLDAHARSLNVELTDDQLMSRQNTTIKEYKPAERGYQSLYQRTVEQADVGADLDFLRGSSGCEVKRESH